jgi:hypothetical protein
MNTSDKKSAEVAPINPIASISPRQSRRSFFKSATLGVAGATGLAVAGASLLAGPSAAHAASNDGWGQGPEGSWQGTLTIEGSGGSPTPKLLSFVAGGVALDTELLDFQPPFLASPGHGVWTAQGPDFAFLIVKMLFDTSGNLQAFIHLSLTAQVDQSNNAFSGSGTLVFLNPSNGNVLSTFNVTLAATRIQGA